MNNGEQEKEMNTNIMTSFHDKPLKFERGKRKFNHSLHGQRIELSHFLIIKRTSGNVKEKKKHGWSTEWKKVESWLEVFVCRCSRGDGKARGPRTF